MFLSRRNRDRPELRMEEVDMDLLLDNRKADRALHYTSTGIAAERC